MTQLIIDIGDAPNDGTGDPVRDAFNKCNNNFTELYQTGPWTAWTPTISASAGSITSATINRARYTQAGKTITALFDVSVTNVGTGSGFLQISLPVTCSALGGGMAYGREIAVAGGQIIGDIVIGGTAIKLLLYNGTTLLITGYQVYGIAVYEAA